MSRILQGWAMSALMVLALAGCGAKSDGREPASREVGRVPLRLAPSDPLFKEIGDLLCSDTACRNGFSVRLRMPNAPDLTTASAMRWPYLNEGRIFLYAGETVSFEAKAGARGPTDLGYVDKAAHPERALTVRLEQPSDVAAGYGMRLTVSNPFDKALKYEVSEVRPGGVEDMAVGLCPVAPHGESRKTWPYPLVQVVILNFSFVPNEQAEACAP